MVAARLAPLVLALLLSRPSPEDRGQENSEDKARRIGELVTLTHESGRFNGSVLVARGGTVIYRKGFGPADLERKTPNEPGTKFMIGSMTKPFTAILVFQLVQEGKLRLEGTVSEYLPGYREDTGRKITLAHLLLHASGLPCYTRKPGFWRDYGAKPHDVAEFVRECCSQDPEFDPGTRRAYSNSGYYVLGAILEKVSGKAYGELLQERILGPAGMRDTGFDREGKILSSCASGYLRSGRGLEKAPRIDPTATFAAGGMHSTVEDLHLLDRALAAGRLLSGAQQEIMTARREGNYGYGWIVEKLQVGDGPREVIAVSHSGGVHGYNGDMCRFPEDGHFVALLANQRVGAVQMHQMSLEIAGLLYGTTLHKDAEAPAPPPPQEAPPKDKPGGKLGIGFLLAPATEGLLPKLTSDRDFVDLVLGPGKIQPVRNVKPPVQVVCLSMSLQGMEKTVSLLEEAGIPPDRLTLGYNPEQREVTPAEELKDFLGSLKRGRQLARQINARFLAGPGLRFMEAHEDLYPEAAKLCDAWMIQSQRLQADPKTKEAVPVEEYRKKVGKIVDLLRKGNPDIKVFVQILAGREKGEVLFNAAQVSGYALAIEDLVYAIRVYGGSAELIAEVLDRIRPRRDR